MSGFKIQSLTITTFLMLQLTACGGSGSGSGSGSDEVWVTPPVIPPFSPPPPAKTLLTGKFIDSAVSGLAYTTESQSGVTDDEGNFEYIAGENITLIKAFNTHTQQKQVSTNIFTPESDTAAELFVDVLDDCCGGPRHSRPVGDRAFYDFTAKHSAVGANLGQVYIWFDDALTSDDIFDWQLIIIAPFGN